MLEIIFVRHGQSEGNRARSFAGHSDSPLTELGHRQAEATAELLAGLSLDAIYASDLPRALQTAEPIVRRTGAPLEVDPALRERDIGSLTGMTFTEVAEQMPEAWQALLTRDPLYRPPGGESLADCKMRVGGFLDALLKRREAGRVVLVSHGVAIRQMLGYLLPAAEDGPLADLRVDNCSVQRVERRADGTLHMGNPNDTAHLTALAVETHNP
jgi:2,3-bisphosphoglycerate-dependent phosphoglycerate mutase